jgi:hypothetical protein
VIVQVARGGIRVGSREALDAARERIRRDCCVRLPQFLEPDLLHWFQRQIAGVEFRTLVHALVDPPAVELEMQSEALLSRLLFLVNDARLFDTIEYLGGCDPIGCLLGRVYKMVPGAGHRDTWHHDVDDSRLMTLSINLGDRPYEGGVLQIMDWAERRLIHEVANTGPGDAILFPLSLRWRHQLTEVTGEVPKIAFAGWFERAPRYAERFPRGTMA